MQIPRRPVSASGSDTARLPTISAPGGPTTRLLDVDVVTGRTPPPWAAYVVEDGVCADADRVLITHGPATVYVAGGDEVVISPLTPQDRLSHDFLVYGWGLRWLLLQRRRFALHASVVISPTGQCIAIAGFSGEGKSTTTGELLSRGWTFVCDDLAEVDVTSGTALLVPHDRPVHLHADSIRRLGADPEIGRPLPWTGKLAVRVSPDMTPRPLDAILQLQATGDRVGTQRIEPAAAVSIVGLHGDPDWIGHIPELSGDFFRWVTGVADNVPVFDVTRPADSDTRQEVADAVERIAADIR